MTSGQNVKGKNRFEFGLKQLSVSPVGRLCETLKAMWHYATRSASKQKHCLLLFPVY